MMKLSFGVTNQQLYIAIGVPAAINAVLLALLLAYINARISAVESKIDGVSQRVDGVNQRLDDLRDLARRTATG